MGYVLALALAGIACIICLVVFVVAGVSTEKPDVEADSTSDDDGQEADPHQAHLAAQRAVIQAAKDQRAADDAIIARYRERMGK